MSKYQLSAKISDKGAVSVYGLQRFPVTLYADQWDALLAKADSIKAFIEANRSKLKSKDEADAQKEESDKAAL